MSTTATETLNKGLKSLTEMKDDTVLMALSIVTTTVIFIIILVRN